MDLYTTRQGATVTRKRHNCEGIKPVKAWKSSSSFTKCILEGLSLNVVVIQLHCCGVSECRLLDVESLYHVSTSPNLINSHAVKSMSIVNTCAVDAEVDNGLCGITSMREQSLLPNVKCP